MVAGKIVDVLETPVFRAADSMPATELLFLVLASDRFLADEATGTVEARIAPAGAKAVVLALDRTLSLVRQWRQ